MKKIKFLALSAGASVALVACNNAPQDVAEERGAAVQEQAETQADAMEDQADALRDAEPGADPAAVEAQADAIEQEADGVRSEGAARANAMEENAEDMAK